MKMCKNVLVWVLIAIFAFSLTACGSTTAAKTTDSTQVANTTAPADTAASKAPEAKTPAEKVEINFGMIAFQHEIAGWTAMINAANKKLIDKNIEIKITKVPATGWNEYYQKMVTQMAAGNAPDIGRTAESFMPNFINKKQVVELTDYMKDIDMTQYYEKTFQASAYQNGKYYGLPSGIYYMVMYYNKDLFTKAGLPEPSKDWKNAVTFDQIKEYAKKLTSGDGANKTFGFWGGPYMAFIGMYNKSNGGPGVFNPDGTCSMGSDVSKAVYKWFDDLLRIDKTMPSPTVTKVMGPTDLFKAGRLAMYVDGTWDQQTMKGITKFKVGIAAVPAGKGQAYSSSFVDAFVMFKGTKHEKESWEALKAMISKEGFDALAPTGTGGLPVVKATMEAQKDAMFGTSFKDEDKKCYIDAFDNIFATPYNEYYQEADSKINSAMDEWMLGKITSDQFADKAQKIVTDTAAAYKAN